MKQNMQSVCALLAFIFVVCLWLPLFFLRMEVRHERQFRFMPSILLKLGLGKMAAHFEPVLSDWQPHHQQGGLPLVGTQEPSDMLGKQQILLQKIYFCSLNR